MSTAALEVLKWLALVLMTGDHVDAAFFNRTAEPLSELGRMVMPIFAAVFGYNLARPEMRLDKLRSIVVRLLIVGTIAYPFYVVVLGHGFFTLNIMFAFAVAAQCAIWIESKPAGWQGFVVLLIAVSGLTLEFMWAGPLLTLAFRWYWKSEWGYKPEALGPVLALIAAYGLLCVVNQNAWALLSLPLVCGAPFLTEGWKARRHRNAFLIYYPSHLALLATAVVVLKY